ncbi:hypothetical protein [Mameliella sediminis]|uniref:hypothetical protein n=1 Tax=Mameliella sediminis TaxID=2836866 RepID=UPI001C464FE9|nr:hypothetical protein [Mameliella sediminis]MBV7392925.1 hypothetical protein [Mameliella sediminis]
MKRIILGFSALGLLSGCLSAIYGDGEPIGTLNGKALYQTRCTVDLSTAGQKGLFGTGRIPLYGTCEVAAKNRCGDGAYSIAKADRSNRRMITDVIDNGPYRTRRTYPAQDVVLQFTCKA